MVSSTDQLGRIIELNTVPKKVVSLVPSQTELLFDLGLEEEVIGVTKYCVHPAKAIANKTIIGGTKRVIKSKLRQIKPDIVIANKEENRKADIDFIQEEICPVWVSDVKTVSDGFSMISSIGALFQKAELANQLLSNMKENFASLNAAKKGVEKSCLYLIWDKPIMAAGTDTFIHDMLSHAGFKNAIKETRYPEITHQEIKQLKPEYIFLSSEPYTYTNKDVLNYQQLYPTSKVRLVDGELFSWYGSRMRYFPNYALELH